MELIAQVSHEQRHRRRKQEGNRKGRRGCQVSVRSEAWGGESRSCQIPLLGDERDLKPQEIK